MQRMIANLAPLEDVIYVIIGVGILIDIVLLGSIIYILIYLIKSIKKSRGFGELPIRFWTGLVGFAFMLLLFILLTTGLVFFFSGDF